MLCVKKINKESDWKTALTDKFVMKYVCQYVEFLIKENETACSLTLR